MLKIWGPVGGKMPIHITQIQAVHGKWRRGKAKLASAKTMTIGRRGGRRPTIGEALKIHSSTYPSPLLTHLIFYEYLNPIELVFRLILMKCYVMTIKYKLYFMFLKNHHIIQIVHRS